MSTASKLHVLVLEPYYGGSHKYFLEILKELPFEFEFLTMPARKWKWRMRFAAPYFAKMLSSAEGTFDRVLCSTYVDVAALRGLGPKWLKENPILTYFHENQFAYPVEVEDERDMHFGVTNITTALASESIAFNSRYNLDSFLEGVRFISKASPDLQLDDPCTDIRNRSRILYPPVDFSLIDEVKDTEQEDVPVVLWNHRWEVEKGPEKFFQSLYQLKGEGLEFKAVLLGGDYDNCPKVFEEARERLKDRIIFAGYVTDRREYARWLKKSTIAVSTSWNEFFGIAMIESGRAGCVPLLPKRLSYPELFPEEFLYEDDDLVDRLRELITLNKRLSQDRAREITRHYAKEAALNGFEDWIRNCPAVP